MSSASSSDAHKIWVRVSPAVWSQMAEVPVDIMERVRLELERLAEILPLANRPSPESANTVIRCFDLDGFRAYYELDLRKAAITLMHLKRA